MAATTTSPATKATAKKAPAKKTPATKATAKKAPARKTSAATQAATPVSDKDLATWTQQAAWAYAAVVNDVVSLAVEAPKRVPTTRDELSRTRADVVRTGEGLVARVRTNVEQVVTSLNARLEAKAADGRKVADELASDPRVERVTTTLKPVLDQAGNTRSQVKAAVTSVTRTANVATEAANSQLSNATSQAKGVVTSLGKVSDVAVEAGRSQATNARRQVKAARTSTRKTVDAAVEAGRSLAG